MMQSSSYSRPATITPAAVIRATPLPSVSTRWVFGLLKACRYSSWKQGRLHSWRYHALSLPAVSRIPHDGVGAATDLLHLLEVGLLVGGEHGRRAERLRRQRGDPGADPAGDVRPPVLHQVLVRGAAGLVGGEVLQPALLPARGGDPGEPGRVDRVIAPRVDRGRRALEDIPLPGVPGQARHALDRGGPGTEQAHPLVRELVHHGTGVV